MDNLKKQIDNLAKAYKKNTVKLDRSAFIYLEPKKDKKNFAQCDTCMMFTGSKNDTCTIHGKIKITKTMSCGLYVNGKNHVEMAGKEMKAVIPSESGLEDRKVRCENCFYYGNQSLCDLFVALNKNFPNVFELIEKVDPNGCCNANVPKK